MAKKENTDRWFICISRLWVVAFVAFPLLWSACSGPKNEVVKGFEDAAEVPTLRTLDVMTLISDSGVTRYRINAPEWLMYENAQEHTGISLGDCMWRSSILFSLPRPLFRVIRLFILRTNSCGGSTGMCV